MGVGTSTGHILIYDIRSSKPLLIKDHMNETPIKCIEFHKSMNYIYSMDSAVVKIWDKTTVSDVLGDISYLVLLRFQIIILITGEAIYQHRIISGFQ